MSVLRRIGEWLRRYYDRLLSVLALVALGGAIIWGVIGLGKLGAGQRDFDGAMSTMTPAHADAPVVDVAPYRQREEALKAPPQLPAWSNSVFVPETRCYCIVCLRPISMETDKCPFCGSVQPAKGTVEGRDLDGDGMTDIWEKQYGFDYRNREDGAQDADGDLFSNVEEYKGDPQTDPKDPASHPAYATELVIGPVTDEPFQLLFKSVLSLPDGSKKFAVNTMGANPRTYFVKLNESVEGFVVHGFQEKYEERDQGGIRQKVNVSILTLRRERKLIPLVMGQLRSYVEYRASLIFLPDQSVFPARPGDPLEIRGETYKVMTVDIPNETVVIQRLSDGKRFDVHKPPQPPQAAVPVQGS